MHKFDFNRQVFLSRLGGRLGGGLGGRSLLLGKKCKHHIPGVHSIFRLDSIILAKFAHVFDAPAPRFHVARPKERVCDFGVVLFRSVPLHQCFGGPIGRENAIGAGLEDLGKGLRSQVGTMYATKEKGVRYLEMAEGYVTGIALDADNEVIGYQFVSLGKMTDFIKKGDDPNTAWEKAKGQYGRVDDAVKIIDPRKE